jgi:hypothetical protein
LAGRQHRVTANTRSWSVAEEKRDERQKRLDSSGAAAPVKPVEVKQPTIEQLLESFITAKETSNIGPSRISKLRSHLPLLERFLAERSIFFPADITKAEIEAFRNTWKARGWNDLTPIKAQDNCGLGEAGKWRAGAHSGNGRGVGGSAVSTFQQSSDRSGGGAIARSSGIHA